MSDLEIRQLEKRAEASGLDEDRRRLRLARERAGLIPPAQLVDALGFGLATLVEAACWGTRSNGTASRDTKSTKVDVALAVNRASVGPAISHALVYRSPAGCKTPGMARTLVIACPCEGKARAGLMAIGVGVTKSTIGSARTAFGNVWPSVHLAAALDDKAHQIVGPTVEETVFTGPRVGYARAWARDVRVGPRSKTLLARIDVALEWAAQALGLHTFASPAVGSSPPLTNRPDCTPPSPSSSSSPLSPGASG